MVLHKKCFCYNIITMTIHHTSATRSDIIERRNEVRMGVTFKSGRSPETEVGLEQTQSTTTTGYYP